jgi:serine/threonine-protein kinase
MSEPADTEIRIGDVIADKYRVVRLVARGGMGAVYEAQHVVLKRRLALKFLPASAYRRKSSVDRFRREAETAGSLESEHIVAVVDFGVSDGGAPFLVMEYVDGEDLSELLARYVVLPVTRATNLAIQVCRGLAIAHDAGVVHRDLKPSNVVVARRSDGSDLAKIIDFGIAKITSDAANTEPGAFMGTALYMPPEQARGEAIDRRADVYAVGVILYEALSGKRPFEADGTEAVVYKILTKAVTPLAELRPDLPPELAAIVHKAMAPEADARFANAEELAEALAPYAGRPPASHPDLERGAEVMTSALTVDSDDAPPRPAPPSASGDALAAPAAPGRARWLVAGVLVVSAIVWAIFLRGPRADAPSEAVSAPPPAPSAKPSSAPSASAEPVAKPSAAPPPASAGIHLERWD